MILDTLTKIDMLPVHISQTYVSANFLRIMDEEYKDFLLNLPLCGETACFFIDNQFIQRDFFGTFAFREQEYHLCLKQNETILDDGRKVKLPLPNFVDNEIKNIILQSLLLEFKAGGYYQVESERISQLLNIVQRNAKKVDKAFTIDQIIKCLVKLEHVQMFIRRKHHVTWYPVSWIINFDLGPLDYLFYQSLNEK